MTPKMLRASAILSIAVVAIVADTVPNVGSFSTSFANIRGILEPISSATEGITSYIFKYVKNGVPVAEENVSLRCSSVGGSSVSHGDGNYKPVLECRNLATGMAVSVNPATTILLSAEKFARPDAIRDLNLSIGRTVWQKLLETQATVTSLARPIVPVVVPGPDFLKIFNIPNPFLSNPH